MKKIKQHHLIVCAFVIGALIGLLVRQEVTILQLIGDVFVKLIKLAVVPVILVAIVRSILNLSETANAKKMCITVLAIFTITTAVSATIGIINALIINPGNGNIVVDQDGVISQTAPTFKEFVLNLIPSNPFAALVEGNTFHVIFLAACIGIAILAIGRSRLTAIISLFDNANDIVMKYVEAIIKLSPIGVLALTATAFAKFATGMIINLAKYFLTIVISVALIYALYLIILLVFSRGRVKSRLKGLAKIWAVAASTSSSAATLPVSMQVCDELGIKQRFSRFILPLGTTMNMNGAAQFMAVTFVFLAQVYGLQINFGGLILAILMVTILVMATPGIPGGAMVPTTIILTAFNIPIEYFSLVLGLYSLIDMLDTTLNVTGDVITSIVIDKMFSNKDIVSEKNTD